MPAPRSPKMSRPRKLDDALRAQVLRSILEGATLAEAAEAAGCVARTLHREAARDAAFGERLAIARRAGEQARYDKRLAEQGVTAPDQDISPAEIVAILADALRHNWTDKTASPSERAA